MTSSKFVLRIVVVCGSIIVTTLTWMMLSVILVSLRLKNGNKMTNAPYYSYQTLMIDSKTDTSKSGFINLQTELQDDEFLSYQDSVGKLHLISNFGTNEYKCTGRCYCGDFERRSSATMSRGVVYLLAALSSVLAIRKAQDHFTEECVNKMESCSDSQNFKVLSEVDGCEKVVINEISNVYERSEEQEKTRNSKVGKVRAVNTSTKKGVVKTPVEVGYFKVEHGIEGDAHAGEWHRQVSLLAVESADKVRQTGLVDITDGRFAENITTEGLELCTLPIGTKMKIGETIQEVTQIGKECHGGCEIKKLVGDCVMPREGIFTRVLVGGAVRPGDLIEILD